MEILQTSKTILSLAALDNGTFTRVGGLRIPSLVVRAGYLAAIPLNIVLESLAFVHNYGDEVAAVLFQIIAFVTCLGQDVTYATLIRKAPRITQLVECLQLWVDKSTYYFYILEFSCFDRIESAYGQLELLSKYHYVLLLFA